MNRGALEERKKVLGVKYPDILTSVDNLISMLWSQGKYEAIEKINR